MGTRIRSLNSGDVDMVAFIHAASWRSAYRGILRDEFLESNLEENRRVLWRKRLLEQPANHFGFIAFENECPVGFAFAFGDEDATWGTQLDNLHVLPQSKGKGVGKELLRSVCCECKQSTSSTGLYLWVYEANVLAQQFYLRLGATRGERTVITAPSGGEIAELRFWWPSVDIIFARSS